MGFVARIAVIINDIAKTGNISLLNIVSPLGLGQEVTLVLGYAAFCVTVDFLVVIVGLVSILLTKPFSS